MKKQEITTETEVYMGKDLDMSFLPVSKQDNIRALTVEIIEDLGNVANLTIQVAEKLFWVKDRLDHGEWQEYLSKFFPNSARQARYLLNVHEKFGHLKGNPGSLLNFQKKALVVLSAPSVPEEARKEAEDRATKGEQITKKVAKEIKEKHTPKKDKPEEKPEIIEDSDTDEPDTTVYPPPPPPGLRPWEKDPPKVQPPFKSIYSQEELPNYGIYTDYSGDDQHSKSCNILRERIVAALNEFHTAMNGEMAPIEIARLLENMALDITQIQSALISAKRQKAA